MYGTLARPRRPAEALRSMRMSRDLAPEPVRVGNDSLHLIERVLRGLRIVAMRKYTAGGADFDQVGAVLDDLPRFVLDGFDAIGHTRALHVRLKRQQIVVAVSACNAQCRTADQHARSGHVAGVNRIAQSNIGEPARAHVADRRKTSVERGAGIARTVQGLARPRNRKARVAEIRSHRNVRVRVDQSRQDGSVREIDELLAAWRKVIRPNRFDLVSFDHDLLLRKETPGLDVKHAPRADHTLLRRRCGLLRPAHADATQRNNKYVQITSELHSIPPVRIESRPSTLQLRRG